jgi:hypothetical protein
VEGKAGGAGGGSGEEVGHGGAELAVIGDEIDAAGLGTEALGELDEFGGVGGFDESGEAGAGQEEMGGEFGDAAEDDGRVAEEGGGAVCDEVEGFVIGGDDEVEFAVGVVLGESLAELVEVGGVGVAAGVEEFEPEGVVAGVFEGGAEATGEFVGPIVADAVGVEDEDVLRGGEGYRGKEQCGGGKSIHVSHAFGFCIGKRTATYRPIEWMPRIVSQLGRGGEGGWGKFFTVAGPCFLMGTQREVDVDHSTTFNRRCWDAAAAGCVAGGAVPL